MRLNLNMQCTVVLNASGVDELANFYRGLGARPPELSIGSTYTAPLWQIMAIFGPLMLKDVAPPFESWFETTGLVLSDR